MTDFLSHPIKAVTEKKKDAISWLTGSIWKRPDTMELFYWIWGSEHTPWTAERWTVLDSSHIAGPLLTIQPVCHMARNAHLSIHFNHFRNRRRRWWRYRYTNVHCRCTVHTMMTLYSSTAVPAHTKGVRMGTDRSGMTTEVIQQRWEFLVSSRINRYVMWPQDTLGYRTSTCNLNFKKLGIADPSGCTIRYERTTHSLWRHTHYQICVWTQSEEQKTFRSTKKKMWRTTFKRTQQDWNDSVLFWYRNTGQQAGLYKMSVKSVTEQDRQCTCARVTSHWGAFAQVAESAY